MEKSPDFEFVFITICKTSIRNITQFSLFAYKYRLWDSNTWTEDVDESYLASSKVASIVDFDHFYLLTPYWCKQG